MKLNEPTPPVAFDTTDFVSRSKDVDTQDCLGILEQATAACWGSLAVIDR